MAEVASSSALTAVDGEYILAVKEFDPAGKSTTFSVPVPHNVTAGQASLMLRAAILKKTSWKDKDFPTILHATMYADNYGLDIMAGDVYMAEEGRLSTTAGAKIKHAMQSGKIEGYSVEIEEGAIIEIPYKAAGKDTLWRGKELTAKIRVQVKGWSSPVVYEARLSEWFTGRNPNWRFRPSYMLRKNALGKVLEEIVPLGTEADEAPPVDIPTAVMTQSSIHAKQIASTT